MLTEATIFRCTRLKTEVNAEEMSGQKINYSIDGHYHHEVDDIIKGGKHKYVNGYMRVPDAPGIGVEFDDEKVAYYHQQFKNLKSAALINGERPDTNRHLSRSQY